MQLEKYEKLSLSELMLYKIFYDYGKLTNELRLSLGLLHETEKSLSKVSTDLLHVTEIPGVRTMRIKPSPFLVLTFNPPSHNVKDSFSSITLNRFGKYNFIQAMRKMCRDFVDNKNLYFYYNKELKLNKGVAENIVANFKIGDKYIKLVPAVIVNPNNNLDPHEGILMSVNVDSNYCTLTFSEMEYLIYALEHIDLDIMSVELLRFIENKPDVISYDNEIHKLTTRKPIVEDKGELPEQFRRNIVTPVGNTIPNI